MKRAIITGYIEKLLVTIPAIFSRSLATPRHVETNKMAIIVARMLILLSVSYTGSGNANKLYGQFCSNTRIWFVEGAWIRLLDGSLSGQPDVDKARHAGTTAGPRRVH